MTRFTISPQSQQGDVYSTEFAFTATLPFGYNKITWDIGDGTFDYNKRTVNRTYSYPGTYRVALSAWNDVGGILTDSGNVTVDYVYRDCIKFNQVPSLNGKPGIRSTVPFVISLTSVDITRPTQTIILQSVNSQCVPHYAAPSKWSFITPRWRFTDLEGNILPERATIPVQPIYKNSKVVAVSGSYQFYYIADLPTTIQQPATLVASLCSEQLYYPNDSPIYPYASYSNVSAVTVTTTWQISDPMVSPQLINVGPTRLKVTENYINEIYPLKWANIPIPVMLTCEATDLTTSEPIKILSYPSTNEIGATYPVTLQLSSNKIGHVPSNTQYFSTEPNLYFKKTDKDGNYCGGYIFTSITPFVSLSGHTLCIIAKTADTAVLSGKSSEFSLYDSDNTYQLAKINEEFDCTAYFRSLALPEILSQNNFLFENFFAAVVGDSNPTTESVGRIAYERIANFVSNHSDYETAEIDQLISLASELAIEPKVFGHLFPAGIKRLLNIFSISKQRLRGIVNLDPSVTNNLGKLLEGNSLIIASNYYFIRDKKYDTIQLMCAAPLNDGRATYPLSDLVVAGLREPLLDNYYFFEYNDQNVNGYSGNIINWDSDYTKTLTYNLSSNEEWYKDGGLIETMFNNLLTKQLFG